MGRGVTPQRVSRQTPQCLKSEVEKVKVLVLYSTEGEKQCQAVCVFEEYDRPCITLEYKRVALKSQAMHFKLDRTELLILCFYFSI